MSLLFTIVYAAHANGTHHKLALDALRHLEGPNSEGWQRLFLKYASVYLAGSKAPDTEFKDFNNHVLHVRDGYWGGAADKAANWYQHTLEALRERDFERAVYAAGVLSHYITDPIHPFHTAQSEAENNIHRAVEWSINRSYDALYRGAQARANPKPIPVLESRDWLKALVCAGAEHSNADYEKLIAHYDIHKGVVDPPAGLDAIARRLVADLLHYAARTHGVVLSRLFAEADVAPPEVDLALDTVLAALQIPLKWVIKKIDDAATRRQVEAMYDELMAHGRVENNLPADDKMVRDLFEREVAAPRRQAAEAARARAVAESATRPARRNAQRLAKHPPDALAAAPLPGSVLPSVPRAATTAPLAATSDAPARSASAEMRRPEPATAAHDDALPDAPTSTPAAAPLRSLSQLDRKPRVYLAATDPVEAAPSIGPRMAERLAAVGILTVADLLATNAEELSHALADRRITPRVISDWQNQARLVLSVPGLRGTHAQLLVGAGLGNANELSAAEPQSLAARLLAFAATNEGARILRDGDTPDVEAISRWIRLAKDAQAA